MNEKLVKILMKESHQEFIKHIDALPDELVQKELTSLFTYTHEQDDVYSTALEYLIEKVNTCKNEKFTFILSRLESINGFDLPAYLNGCQVSDGRLEGLPIYLHACVNNEKEIMEELYLKGCDISVTYKMKISDEGDYSEPFDALAILSEAGSAYKDSLAKHLELKATDLAKHLDKSLEDNLKPKKRTKKI